MTAPHTSSPATINAVLCTNDSTFQLRQVQSSNSIFLLKPSVATNSSEEGSIPTTNVSVVAQCKVTLELVPVAPSALQYLKESLPVYRNSPGDSSSKIRPFPSSEPPAARSKLAVLDDAPMSAGEFESGWIEICAFETGGQAWRPLASTLHGVWESVLSAAAVNELKLDDGFPTSSITSLVEEDGYSTTLLVAVLTRLSPTEDIMSHDCKLDFLSCM